MTIEEHSSIRRLVTYRKLESVKAQANRKCMIFGNDIDVTKSLYFDKIYFNHFF